MTRRHDGAPGTLLPECAYSAHMTTPDATRPARVRHVVHIRLDPGLDGELRASLEDDLRRLVAEHPHAVHGSLHRDLDRKPEASVSATWMVSMDFMSMDDFEEYLASPLHRDFLQTHLPSMDYISAIQVPVDGG